MIFMGKFVRTYLKKPPQNQLRRLFASKKEAQKAEDAIIERKEEVQLMEDNYEKVKMQGLHERDITGIDNFQRDILTQNKFDLLNPKIEPKIASLSTTMGLDVNNNNYLAEINLGKIKVKKENEVFLSEVDPYNIPEYYDIVFDYEKEMSLVGKKIEGTKNKQEEGGAQGSEMKISTKKAFEQKSQEQLMRQTFGVSTKNILNRRLLWKQYIISLILTIFISDPLIRTYAELYVCHESIKQIEDERMKQIIKLKKESLMNALIDNPDMSIQ